MVVQVSICCHLGGNIGKVLIAEMELSEGSVEGTASHCKLSRDDNFENRKDP
jgi:hypothetical protein